MKPYCVINIETRKILGEYDSFTEGWDAIKNMSQCELIRVQDNKVLAEKGKKVDTTIPFVGLTSTGAPIRI